MQKSRDPAAPAESPSARIHERVERARSAGVVFGGLPPAAVPG